MFDKELRRYDVSHKTIFESEGFPKALSDSGARTADDLMAQIGYGTLSARQLLGKLVPIDRLREKPPDGVVTAAVKRAFGGGEEKIKVRGSDDVLVFRARCCNPIRGEKIVGYITRGKGVSVHSATCPNVVNLLYDPERRIEVEWEKSTGRRGGRLHGQAHDGGGRPERRARGGQREDRRHQHQHPEHGSAYRRRRSARED